jgi:hypothetical protein
MAIAGRDGIVVVLLLAVFIAPAFYAAYRYAFRSPEVWQPQEKQ